MGGGPDSDRTLETNGPRATPQEAHLDRRHFSRAAIPGRAQPKETTIGTNTKTLACACDEPDASHQCFITVQSGVDDTNGRYADVRLDRCRHCERLWLHYAVVYEGFSRSGRWARGLITEAEAKITGPQDGPAHLEQLPSYIYGGSYFDGQAGVRSGAMNWDY
jgi:hypothetical protein